MNVFADIVHTYPGDLDITLLSPAGTVATMTTDNGGGSDNALAGTLLDDQANRVGSFPHHDNDGLATAHRYANLTTVPALAPEEALAAFNGENANGTWTLIVRDDATGDGGTLRGWRLDVTTGACLTPTPTPSPTPTPAPTATATATATPPPANPAADLPALVITDTSRRTQPLSTARSRGVQATVRTAGREPARARLADPHCHGRHHGARSREAERCGPQGRS